jgi:hypothetical protein
MKQKKSVLLLLLLPFLSSISWADTLDPCADSLDSVGVLSPEYLASSTQMRVETLCEFRNAIIGNYSLFNLKKERLTALLGAPFDSLTYLNQCVTKEKNISDDSDLHFMDRMSQYIAGFHDTHFSAQAAVPMPLVLTGIVPIQISGKYYIAATTPAILQYVNLSVQGDFNLVKAFVQGNEIISVDGQKPADIAAHYASFVSGSSNDYVQEIADQSIFLRNFDYPTKNSISLMIKDATGKIYSLAIPWWAGFGAHSRADANEYFQKVGIPLTDRVKISMTGLTGKVDWKKVGLQNVGFTSDTPIYHDDPYNQLLEYNDDSGTPALRVGEVVIQEGFTACYMQLLTFEAENFTLGSKTDTFVNTIANFVQNCGNKGLNLILDIRSNPGGDGSLPDKLLSILTEPGKTYPGPVMALRTTEASIRLQNSLIFAPEMVFRGLGMLKLNPVDILMGAISKGQTETDIIPDVALGADPSTGGGYSGKILLLVTPDCVSSCDMTASLLKKSGRATLLGTHSNGTGAGFQSTNTLDSDFKDSNYELATEIPNFLFGVPDQVLDDSKTYSYAQYENSYLLENHPTIADIQYQTTLDDLNPEYFGLGWKKAVAKAFYALETSPVPAPVTNASASQTIQSVSISANSATAAIAK